MNTAGRIEKCHQFVWLNICFLKKYHATSFEEIFPARWLKQILYFLKFYSVILKSKKDTKLLNFVEVIFNFLFAHFLFSRNITSTRRGESKTWKQKNLSWTNPFFCGNISQKITEKRKKFIRMIQKGREKIKYSISKFVFFFLNIHQLVSIFYDTIIYLIPLFMRYIL